MKEKKWKNVHFFFILLHKIVLKVSSRSVLRRNLGRRRHRVGRQELVVAPRLLRRRRGRRGLLLLLLPRRRRGLPGPRHLEVERLLLSRQVRLRDLPARLLDPLDGVPVRLDVFLEPDIAVVVEADL